MDIVRILGTNLPAPVVKIARPVYYRYDRAKTWAVELADAYGVIGPEDVYGEEYYEKRQSDPWRSEGNQISNVIAQQFKPRSVIDFGCAIGHYLEPFHGEGVEVHGIDGHPAAQKHAVIPEDRIELFDLRQRYQTEKKYDICLCFEVAEHLPKKHAQTLVESLTAASDTIVFTAAKPEQSGTHHVHLRPREYWIDQFEEAGAEYDPDAVEDLRGNIDVNSLDYMSENLFVFRQG